jgi:peptide subunit release factor 1 (eRF1)
MTLHFYELHEGASDLLTNALLISERAYSGEEFAALVRTARQAVIETFEEDTLVEAVARELERAHGFTYIGDEKLAASMSVGASEEDTFLVDTSEDFRSIVVELDRS